MGQIFRDPLQPNLPSAEWQECLSQCELFPNLSEDELKQVNSLCAPTVYQRGETLFTQGERSEYLYIVVDGAIALIRELRNEAGQILKQVTTDIVEKGRIFGWSALLKPHVHTTTARAMARTELLVIAGADLRFLLEKNHPLGFEVMGRLCTILDSRMRALYRALDSHI